MYSAKSIQAGLENLPELLSTVMSINPEYSHMVMVKGDLEQHKITKKRAKRDRQIIGRRKRNPGLKEDFRCSLLNIAIDLIHGLNCLNWYKRQIALLSFMEQMTEYEIGDYKRCSQQSINKHLQSIPYIIRKILSGERKAPLLGYLTINEMIEKYL